MKKILIVMLVIYFTCIAFAKAKKIQTAVSITPLAYFVNEIAKDKVDIIIAVPNNANPHSYEPLPRMMVKLNTVDLYVKLGIGLSMESEWLDKVMKNNHNLRVCNVSQNIELMDMFNEHEDPHIWLSPMHGIIITRNIMNALIDIDPSNKNFYKNNADMLIAKLLNLHNELTEIFDNMENKTFLTFHPSWGYFAKDFGLTQIAIEHNGKELTSKNLADVINTARQNNIKTIFVSYQFDSRSAQIIANEIHGKVIKIDPLSRNYINNLQNMAKLLKSE